jgi:hypothetical protein
MKTIFGSTWIQISVVGILIALIVIAVTLRQTHKKEEKWINIPKYVWIVFLSLILVGIFLIISGIVIEPFFTVLGTVSATLGSVLSIECGMHLVHDYGLKNGDREMLKELIKEKLSTRDKDDLETFREGVQKVVEENVKSLDNARKLGLVHIFSAFDPSLFFKSVKTYIEGRISGEVYAETNIMFQRIYFSEPEYDALIDNIDDLIQKNCKIKILFLSPKLNQVIERRAKQFHQDYHESDPKWVKTKMQTQLEKLYLIQQRYMNCGMKESFDVRVHSDFVSVALSGYDDTIFCGIYLQKRRSSDGVQFVAKGKTPLYNELIEHFDAQFRTATGYKFEGNDFKEVSSNL